VIVVLFGESHLSPQHLPRLLHHQLPEERIGTILQNVDSLYWVAAGEKEEQVDAVRVSEKVVCVFNATPVEKYENYRMHLARWAHGESEVPDLTPTIHNLVDSLAAFSGINRYSSHNGTQPKFLVDMLPEVYSESSEAGWRRLFSRLSATSLDVAALLKRVEERGSIYLPQVNAFYVHDFQMVYAAEEATRFLHQACRGLPQYGTVCRAPAIDRSDEFYLRAMEHALAYFGSRVLHPARPNDEDEPGELSTAACKNYLKSALRGDCDEVAQRLGYQIGGALYADYLAGKLSRGKVRRLMLVRIDDPGIARSLCLKIAGAEHSPRKKRPASASLIHGHRHAL
jgi:hypothetical protein